MIRDLPFLIEELHTTPLGVMRICRNLSLHTPEKVVEICRQLVLHEDAVIEQKGKNWYVTSKNIRLTINMKNKTIITAHLID